MVGKKRYTLEEKNRIYDYWKKHGSTYQEVADHFNLPSQGSVAGIIQSMMDARRREREKAGTVRYHEQVGDKIFLVVRPGWCWPENVKAAHEHTGNGVQKENAPVG